MRFKVLLCMAAFALIAVPVFAQELTATAVPASGQAVSSTLSLPAPGWTPAHPLYFLKDWAERLNLFFTFNQEKKAEKALKYADEKVAEMQAVAESNDEKIQARKEQLLEKLRLIKERYEARVEKAEHKAEDAGERVDALKEKIVEQQVRHQEVLEKVLEKMPEAASSTIEKVIQASKERYEQRIEKLDTDAKERIQSQLENRLENLKELKELRERNVEKQLNALEDDEDNDEDDDAADDDAKEQAERQTQQEREQEEEHVEQQ